MKRLGAFLIVLATTLIVAGSASAVTITEFAVNPGKLAFPRNIVSGPEGNLWWTEDGQVSGIGRISTTGERFPFITDSEDPVDLVVAPDGWVSWTAKHGTVSRNPAGIISPSAPSDYEYGAIILSRDNKKLRWGAIYPPFGSSALCTLPGSNFGSGEQGGCAAVNGMGHIRGQITGLAETPAGILWASIAEANKVFAALPGAPANQVIDLPSDSGPQDIAIGPEGNIWVAMFGASAIDRFTPDGARTRFPLPAGSRPEDLVLGPDGAFWITEAGTGKIGRMTTAGTLTNEYPVPSGELSQEGITVGPDGNIWFTDPEGGAIGRLVPDPVVGLPVDTVVAPPTTTVVGPPTDTVALRILGSPSFSPSRFQAAGKAGARPAVAGRRSAPVGSRLKLSLSAPATVTARIAHETLGRRSGSRCIAPNKAEPGAKKCTRFVDKGTFKAEAKTGANAIPFSGKVGGRRLGIGGYRATLTARDASGRASEPASASFAIVP